MWKWVNTFITFVLMHVQYDNLRFLALYMRENNFPNRTSIVENDICCEIVD